MFCKKCGKQISPGQKFCINCGAVVETNNNVRSGGSSGGSSRGSSKSMFPILLIIAILVGGYFGKDYIMEKVEYFKFKKESTFIGNENNISKKVEPVVPETTQRRELTFSELVANARLVSSYGMNSTVEDFDTVKFGKYYKSGSSKSDIEWIVINKDVTADGRKYAILTSKYVLDCVQYYAKNEYTFWETSNARMWLNNNFYNEAFSSSDKEKIIEMPLANPRNMVYPNVEGGNNTFDKVFLLNCDECILYFGNEVNGQNSKLATSATDYAVSKGAYRHMSNTYGNGNTMFWLRSPGSTKSNACDVSPVGYLNFAGNMVNLSQGVRPTIFVWY